MVILADELLEGFFGHDLAASFQLEKVEDEDYHQSHQKPEGLLGGLMNLVVTNESADSTFRFTPELTCRNKNRFNRLADGFGAALGKHAEWRKPALAKTMPSQQATTDLGTRESLLTPSNSGAATSNRDRAASQSSMKSTSSSITTTEGRNLAEVERRYREESEMVKQAQAAVNQRPNFAIDAIGDSDGEDDEEDAIGTSTVGGEDDAVMDEVEAFLKAHGEDDGGVKGEQKKLAEGKLRSTVNRAIGLKADLLKAEPVK